MISNNGGTKLYPDSNLSLSYETDDTVYWFSHAFDPLNNWSANTVKIWGEIFPTVEHGYHYQKFVEAYPELAQQILAAPSPWAAMQVERRHTDKRRKDWQDVKVNIMTELIRAKVAQNKDVRDCLLKTANKQIVENSPWDDFWGIGKDRTGKNQMGKILMQVREELKRG